jgi:hypothetical protein
VSLPPLSRRRVIESRARSAVFAGADSPSNLYLGSWEHSTLGLEKWCTALFPQPFHWNLPWACELTKEHGF